MELTIFFIVYVEAQQPFYNAALDPEASEAVGSEYVDEAPAWADLLFSRSLLLPSLVAAGAYFALFFRAKDAKVRYRILLLSGGFILWMGFSIGSTLSRFATGV